MPLATKLTFNIDKTGFCVSLGRVKYMHLKCSTFHQTKRRYVDMTRWELSFLDRDNKSVACVLSCLINIFSFNHANETDSSNRFISSSPDNKFQTKLIAEWYHFISEQEHNAFICGRCQLRELLKMDDERGGNLLSFPSTQCIS